MFQIKWLRRLVRRHTNPIGEDEAHLWKRRLSIGYALLAWQAIGLVGYMFYTGKADWAKYHGLKTNEELAMSPAQHFSKTMNMERGKILRFSGLKKTEEIDFVNDIKKE